MSAPDPAAVRQAVESLLRWAAASPTMRDDLREQIRLLARDWLALNEERDAARAETERLAEIIDRLIDQGVETWNSVVNDESSLASWLGLTDTEYKTWFEKGAAAFAAAPPEKQP